MAALIASPTFSLTARNDCAGPGISHRSLPIGSVIVPSSPRVLAEKRLIVRRRPSWPEGKFTASGKTSWFMDGNTATGLHGHGIATRYSQTKLGWWLLRAPNGVRTIAQDVDWGPAEWTGRWLDLLPETVRDAGYNPDAFPTDQGVWAGRYLGRHLPRGMKVGRQPRLSALGVCGFSGRVYFTIVADRPGMGKPRT